MTELKVFDYEGKGVRTVDVENSTWWVLKDVCDVLGLTNPAIVADRLDDDEVSQTYVINSLGRQQETYVINESGLYNVILRCDKPAAKPFRKWVTNEVLPSIRKTGKYSLNKETISLKERLKIASILKSTPKARMPAIYKILEPYIGEMPIDVPANNSAAEQEKRLRMAVYELVCDEKYILKKLDKNRVAIDRNEIKKVAFDIGITYMAAMKFLDDKGLIQRDSNDKRTMNLGVNGIRQRLVVFFVNKVLNLK